MVTAAIWPALDYSRVPYRLYHDPEVYRHEQERIFRGPTWNFLALESRSRTRAISARPMSARRRSSSIATRTARSTPSSTAAPIAARWSGARRQRQRQGSHLHLSSLVLHAHGALIGDPVPPRAQGKGGMGPISTSGPNGLRRLTVGGRTRARSSARFADGRRSLEDYLGAVRASGMIDRFFDKPIRILGYQRQRSAATGSSMPRTRATPITRACLHEFLVTFGLDRSTQRGGVKMDARHRHNMTWAEAATATPRRSRRAAYTARRRPLDYLALKEPALRELRPGARRSAEHRDARCSFRRGLVQINNSMAMRQIRPHGHDAVEVFQTMFGYADDTRR